MEIRALLPSDDRSRFRSGDADLDRFLRAYAGQNQFRRHLATTYVALESGRLLAYVTVAAGQIEVETLPVAERRGLPRYPLPILRLARLAVDEGVQGLGLGKEMLRFVFHLALRMMEGFGCVGVCVDARPASVRFYEQYGFVPIDLVIGGADLRPTPQPLFLAISRIQAATNPTRQRRP